MSGSEAQPGPEFQILVSGLRPEHADEVARGLSEFGIPATIRPAPGAMDSQYDSWIGGTVRQFEVLVAAPYLEPAREYLRGTTHRPEGEADCETILEDLQSDELAPPSRSEFARFWRWVHRHDWLISSAIFVVIAAIFVVMVIGLLRILMDMFD